VKLTVKTTFSFEKLARKLPKVLEKHSQRITRSSAQGAKENIEKGVSPPLRQSTIDKRKARGTGGSKPLFETGALFRSIKGTSKGLEMLEYGLWHHQGSKRPPRPFITPSEKTILKSFDAFRKDLRKAFKK
jgi:hypothetical protein